MLEYNTFIIFQALFENVCVFLKVYKYHHHRPPPHHHHYMIIKIMILLIIINIINKRWNTYTERINKSLYQLCLQHCMFDSR